MDGKVVVITGGSAGIGAASAESLTKRGASVALVARREKELQETAERCGPNAMAIVADVTSRAENERVVQAAIERFGHIDVWVNNVGRGITRLPSELTDADIDDIMRVNVKSMLYGIQAILPHFKERGTGQIVNVSSMLGRVPSATFRSAYNGAKHFVNAITWNLREELRAQFPGIVVTLLSPGVVATDFGSNAMHGGPDSHTLPNAQDVHEVGAVMAWAIEEQRTDVYTRPGSKAWITSFYEKLGEDPAILAPSTR
jgi:NADP-dependent 3-hydroxy acid dehydrogenase YdfG